MNGPPLTAHRQTAQTDHSVRYVGPPVEVATAYLRGKRGAHGWWSCHCPAHEDKNPSLGVKQGDNGGLVFKCQAGCTYPEIQAVLPEYLRNSPSYEWDHSKTIHQMVDQKYHKQQDPAGTFEGTTTEHLAGDAPSDPGRLALAIKIFERSMHITADDPIGCYLLARRCKLPPEESHLRWQDRYPHPSGYMGPAMIALVTDAVTGAPMTIHHTWIDPRDVGKKAPLDKPRLLYPGLRKSGGVIRLFPDDMVLEGLAIGEGIETCLAAAHGFTPIWSVLDADNMTSFPILQGLEALTIIVDHDPAGSTAATKCADRWFRAGHEVRCWQSPRQKEDAADFLMRVSI